MADLTVIIPNIPGREQTLKRTLMSLAQQTVDENNFEVLLVWDWAGAPAPLPKGLPFKTRIVQHEHNCGLATARNTGLDHAQTPLAMFLDDDIAAFPQCLAQHLKFHRKNPDPMIACIGRYLWSESEQSGLVSWFQSEGNWSVFSEIQRGEPFPLFVGGCTSFKTKTFREERFDQRFRHYGGEDHEFGIRFFAKGGKLIYLPEAGGDHLKELNVQRYWEDHVGAGRSHGLSYQRNPTPFKPFFLEKAVSFHATEPRTPQMLAFVETITQVKGRDMSRELDQLMGVITDAALWKGFREFLHEQYPGYAQAEQHIISYLYHPQDYDPADYSVKAAEACPELALLWVIAWERAKDPAKSAAYLDKALELHPYYGYALLQKIQGQATPDAQEALKKVEGFWSHSEKTLRREDRQRYALAFGEMLCDKGLLEIGLRLLVHAANHEPWSTREEGVRNAAYARMAQALHLSGRRRESRAILRRLKRLAPDQYEQVDRLTKLLMQSSV
jgi:GT2 family glycosyltransferase